MSIAIYRSHLTVYRLAWVGRDTGLQSSWRALGFCSAHLIIANEPSDCNNMNMNSMV